MSAADHLKNMRRTYEHATTPAEDAMAPAWSTHDFMQNHAPRLLDAVERVLGKIDHWEAFGGDGGRAAASIRRTITDALEGKDAQHPL